MKRLNAKGVLIANFITNILALCFVLGLVELATVDDGIAAFDLIERLGVGILVASALLTSLTFWLGSSYKK